jgi:lipopolysaccharide transport system permease protein
MSLLVKNTAVARKTFSEEPASQRTGGTPVPPTSVPPVGTETPMVAHNPSSQEMVIEPPRSWQVINFCELWHFRDLIYFLAWRDVKIRYKQTFLGVAWAVLQPALLMVVFAVFFRNMAGRPTGDIPYPLFFYAGLLPWTFFATAISNGGNSVVGSERLITKVYFPRLAIPFAAAGAALVDFVVAGGLLVVLMLVYGVWPIWSWLLVPPIVLLLMLAAVGMGTLLAALNVAYRDFRYVIPFCVQVWMFATPSLYMDLFSDDPAPLSEWAQASVWLNPLTGMIGAFRAAILGGPIPWGPLGLAALSSAVMFFVGCLYFRKVEDSFADVI